MAYVSEVQDTRLVVQGSRIEFGVYCDWSAATVSRLITMVTLLIVTSVRVRFQVSLYNGG